MIFVISKANIVVRNKSSQLEDNKVRNVLIDTKSALQGFCVAPPAQIVNLLRFIYLFDLFNTASIDVTVYVLCL